MPVITLTGQTDGAVIIAAPNPQMIIRVIGGELSSGAAINLVTLKSNGNVKWQTEQMKSSPFSVDLNVDRERTIDGEPGQSMTLGLSGGTATVSLEYILLGCDFRQLTPGSGGLPG